MCRMTGLLKLRHVAIDGSKVKANASKHSAMSYGRMKQEDERIWKEIDVWFKEADRVDAAEDRLYGEDKRGDELPAELQTAEGWQRAIREAMAELEKEAREAGKAEPAEKAQRTSPTPSPESGAPVKAPSSRATTPRLRSMLKTRSSSPPRSPTMLLTCPS